MIESLVGILGGIEYLQEQSALFGANLVHWAVAWVKELLAQANQNSLTALSEVKTLVRVVSRVQARWVRNSVAY